MVDEGCEGGDELGRVGLVKRHPADLVSLSEHGHRKLKYCPGRS